MKKYLALALGLAIGMANSAFAAEINDQLELNGEIRANYLTMKAAVNGHGYESYLRTRLTMVYKPLDDWKIVAMAENEHNLRTKRGSRHHDVILKQAYAEGKIDKVFLTVGRCGINIGNGNVLDDDSDILTIGHNVNEKFKIEALLAQNLDGHKMQYKDKNSQLIGGRLTYAPNENSEIKAEYASFRNLGYTDSADTGHSVKNNILAISTKTQVAKDLTASAVYIRGDAKTTATELKTTSKNGYVLGLAYRGVDAGKKGTWGLNANYYNQGAQTYIDHIIDGNTDLSGKFNRVQKSQNADQIDGNTDFPNGFKGWSISADWVIAKNLVAKVAYYDTKDKEGSDRDERVWSSLTWNF